MTTQIYLDERFRKAVFRYRIMVLISAGITLYMYLFAAGGSSHLAVDFFKKEIVQLANLIGHQAAKIVFLGAVLVVALPLPVLVQILVVRFASKNLA